VPEVSDQKGPTLMRSDSVLAIGRLHAVALRASSTVGAGGQLDDLYLGAWRRRRRHGLDAHVGRGPLQRGPPQRGGAETQSSIGGDRRGALQAVHAGSLPPQARQPGQTPRSNFVKSAAGGSTDSPPRTAR